jgi:choline dehydrogenase-like flavoprotein
VSTAEPIADVLVIGSGAGGGALSWHLAQAGIGVVCLERGDWSDPSTYPAATPDWESRRVRDFHPNPNIRRRETDYPVDDSSSPIKPLMFCGVGGSTILWTAHNPRFHPSDFRVKTLDGVADDWPLSYDELAPHYELNDRMIGVAGINGDPAMPARDPRPVPPLPLGEGADRLIDAFDRLGYHWWPADSAVLTRAYDGRLACNNCGPCELGCTRGSKASSDVTYWPKALEHGAQVITRAAVREITVDGRGRADGAIWLDDDGTEHRQKARVVVLAANGVGTPRLMLLSTSSLYPEGLANSSGQVGRNLMLHPIALATGVFEDNVGSFHGPDGLTIFSQEWYETDPERDFLRGYGIQVTRGQGPLVTALGGFALDVPWGRNHHARFEQLFGHVVTCAVLIEDLPHPTNMVRLSERDSDRFGVPSPQMVYELDDNTMRMSKHGIERSSEVLREAGASEVLTMDVLPMAGFHLMGTARMGDDPSRSVVDSYGRAHDVPNLFVADGSLFTTSAGVNPTPTIQALALRVADHIVDTRDALDVPSHA